VKMLRVCPAAVIVLVSCLNSIFITAAGDVQHSQAQYQYDTATQPQQQQQSFKQLGLDTQALKPRPEMGVADPAQQRSSTQHFYDPPKRGSPRFFGKRNDDADAVSYIAFATRGQPIFITDPNLSRNLDAQAIETRGAPRFFGKRGSPRFFGKRDFPGEISLETRGMPRFIGKREDPDVFDENKIDLDLRGSPRFFGKRLPVSENDIAAASKLSSHHIAKRAARMPMFVGKREIPSMVEKRFLRSFRPNRASFHLNRPYLSAREFKETYRRSNPHFIGKRENELDEAVNQEVDFPYDFKRGIPRFIGKRGIPRFIGKRGIPRFIGKRGKPLFVGRRGSPMFIGRRGRPKFVGRGGQDSDLAYDGFSNAGLENDSEEENEGLVQLIDNVKRLLDDSLIDDDETDQ